MGNNVIMAGRLFSLFNSDKTGKDTNLCTDWPLYVIGDIHGRHDLLMRMLDLISQDWEAHPEMVDSVAVFLGDYIDRGENSAGVLAELQSMSERDDVVCLIGNHDKMLLDFLDDPVRKGPRWLKHGGLQTLASYGIGGLSERSPASDLHDGVARLRAALPNGQEDWLRTLPAQFISGNLVCVHAALDPALPIEDQTDNTRMWGHPDFLTTPRSDGNWVIHGHTIVNAPIIKDQRIAIDTGAYATGNLTAAAIGNGTVRWLSTIST